jgi:ribose transport system ATP-binding protein
MEKLVEIRDISKFFGATRALKDVSFDIFAGEVRALLGENGAGKSTCVKILNGLVRPDRGTLHLDGKIFHPTSLVQAQAAGVSTAFQELSLIPDLTVAVNLSLPEIPRRHLGVVNYRRVNDQAEAILAAYKAFDIRPDAKVNALTLADKQRLEIIRALHRKPKLLILDEPTAALTDVYWLYDQVRALAEQGGAALFITHRLKEVRDLCQRATVFRNGELSGTVNLSDTPDSQLFRLMIGRTMEAKRPALSAARAAQAGAPVLAAHDLCAPGFGPASLAVCPGEIVGVAALEGQGQRALFNALSGNLGLTSGKIAVKGKTVRLRSPVSARASGIAFVPEERKEEGLFFGMPARANVSISRLSRVARFGVIRRRREHAAIASYAKAVDLDAKYFDTPVDALSGGNQQKTIIARALLLGASCFLLFDPTRGVDVGTKESIFAAIRRVAESGAGVLFYSTELRELTAICDRCLVIYGNRIVAEFPSSEISEENLIDRMHGETMPNVDHGVNDAADAHA